MAAIVNIQSHDDQFLYQISAQQLGPTSAAVSERKQDKSSGAVSNATYPLTEVMVVNGVLQGTVHLPGFQSESFKLEPSQPGDAPSETIQTGGLWFGVGAQKLGPFQVSAVDYAAVNAWFENFPHS